jgi:fimbrial chaperone protein
LSARGRASVGVLVALGLALDLAGAGFVSAGTFTINPIQVFLTDAAKSTVVTLQNTSAETLRFQLSVFAWGQSPAGEMLLAPTADIVFFPKLLTLGPRDERKIRVGTSAAAGMTEKTYRLFIEELQSAGRPAPGTTAPQIQVLTRVGVPIFLQPAKAVVAGRIDAVALRGGRLVFTLANTGNVHLLPQTVRVTGRGDTGEVILDRQLPGWYVLAAGTRVFALELGRDDCSRLRAVAVEIRTARAAFTREVAAVPAACAS